MVPNRKGTTAKNVQAVQDVAAPIGGLNVRDPISSMPITDAYALENWVPQQYGLKMRKGYAQWRYTGSATSVKSVFNYFPNTTTVPTTSSFTSDPTTMPGQVFAATDAGIYDITSANLSNATLVQALSGTAEAGRIYALNYSNAAGPWTLITSETDGYYTYDGVTWLKPTMGAGATQINNVDPATFTYVALWKRRCWFIQKNTSKVWYLAADAVYGAATALDVGPLLKRGGALAWISTWTIDAGEGIDDFLVICSENGEILIYKGTDPSSSSTFGLQGRWEVGQIPKGRRGFCALGGDLLVLSTLGISPISFITRGGAQILAASQKDYTSKIAQQFGELTRNSFNMYGWGLHVSTREGILVITVPDQENYINTQYSMTIQNGSWTKFTGMNMLCTAEIGGWTFYGAADGYTYIAFIGNTDAQPLDSTQGNGTAIVGVLQPAFNSMGQGAQLKHFLLARISFLTTRTPSIAVSMNVDFQTSYPISVPELTDSAAPALWDTGEWDISFWDGAPSPYYVWQATYGVGYYGSLTLLTSSTGELTLTNITYIFEKGGVI